MEEPIQILDHKEKQLRNKVMSPLKVPWRSQQIEEAKWESENEIRKIYPHLFQDTSSFGDETFLGG